MIAKLGFTSLQFHYGLWYANNELVTGDYKATYTWGGAHCSYGKWPIYSHMIYDHVPVENGDFP